MSEKNVLLRAEQKPENCWNLADIYPSDEAWEQALADCAHLPEEVAAYQGRLGESAKVLLDYLTRLEQINQQAEKLYVYAMLRCDEDTANAAHQAMKGKCFSFLVKLNTAGAFESPELVALEEEKLQAFYAEEPALEKFRRYLDHARRSKPHILSAAEEALLAGVGEVGAAPGTIFHAFNDADLTFANAMDSDGEEHPLTHGTYVSLMESSDRTLRKNAFKNLYKSFRSFENTLAAAYNAEVKKNNFYAKTRKYENALESVLTPNEVPVEVYRNLVAAVRENLPKLHRYMSLRKKVMGLDELHMYDIYANMVPEAHRDIPFAEAKEEVLAAVSVMGEDYAKVVERAFEERWLDIYENKGKRSGAYSCSCPRVHPYVLLNHTPTLDSVFTLAHELGHTMHSYLSEQAQPPIYADYVLFVAEVASTCNEALLMQHLLSKTTDRKQRAVLVNYFLEQFRTTLYRQTMFAEFELKAHEMAAEGRTLTAESLNQVYRGLNEDYYGKDVVVDEEISIEWARIPHFYRHFYVYQYATGFAAAMALSARILKEGQPAVEDYLKFLSGGCSADPVSLLKLAGVDMSTPKPVHDALELFESLVDELEGLLA